MLRKLFLVVFVFTLIFGLSGCIKFKKDTVSTSNLGGMFFTDDKFETWKTKSLLMTPGETAGSISNTDVYFVKIDPTDDKAFYAGTRADGLYYSYTSGTGWTKFTNLAEGFVRDIAVDPKNKCQLYAAVHTRIFKSIDCGRNWEKFFILIIIQ